MKLRIGSRKSKLAVTQAEWVAKQLKEKEAGLDIEMVWITTTGDAASPSTSPSNWGKGVFVKELEEALLKKEIDLAVHSLKDVPQDIPSGLRIGPAPRREDNRDAFLSRFGEQIHELPRHSVIGTSSPRRRAQILYRFKKRNYRVEPMRGNVDTRLQKLRDGQFDAIVLAVAGLKRLGLDSDVTQILEPEVMMPAPCQGCLGLELREDDSAIFSLLEKIKDEPSDTVARADRAFLQGLGGNCLVPVGSLVRMEGEGLRMEAVILDIEGTKEIRVQHDGPTTQPELVGGQLAERLLAEGGSEILFQKQTGRVSPKPPSGEGGKL
jgi:hydroxymethylbilane synthase